MAARAPALIPGRPAALALILLAALQGIAQGRVDLLEGRTPQVAEAIRQALDGAGGPGGATRESLASIVRLDLRGRSIRSLGKDDLAGLVSLEQLDLEENLLEELPQGFLDAPLRLRGLYLGHNRLQSLDPSLLRNLEELRTLWLGGNQLVALPEGLLDSNPALERLHLGGNRLESLPPRLLASQRRLTRLWLQDNRLGKLPEGLLDALPGLEALDLSGNRIERLPSRPFLGLRSLRTLLLQENRLNRLEDGQCEGLAGLELLDLSGNRMERISPMAPLALPNLRRLDLEGNRLGSLPDWGDCGRLAELRLGGNPLEHELSIRPLPREMREGETLRYAVSLLSPPPPEGAEVAPLEPSGRLRISPPILRFTPRNWRLPQRILLEADLDPDTAEEEVELSHRVRNGESALRLRIRILDHAPGFHHQPGSPLHGRNRKVVGAILDELKNARGPQSVTREHLRSVSSLRLNGKDLFELHARDLAGLEGLEGLYLSGNRLAELPGDLFEPLPNLETLHLSRNRFRKLPPDLLRPLAGLRSLDLHGNGLEALPAGLLRAQESLSYLNLSRNRLEELPEGLLAGCPELRMLRLEANRLAVLPARELQGLSNLQQLSLENNRIGCVPALPRLEGLLRLSLDSNRIEALPEGFFGSLPAAELVSLSRNPLRRLPPGNLAALASVDLEGAPLEDHVHLPFLSASLLPGGSASYPLWLHSPPAHPLRVVPETGTEGVSFDPPELAFGPEDWERPRSVTLRLPGDLGTGKLRIGHRVLSPEGERRSALDLIVAVKDPEPAFECEGGLLHGRTRKVAEAILKQLKDPEDCGSVTPEQLAGIATLSLSGQDLGSIRKGDLDGLTGLRNLYLNRNRLSSLPPGLFSDLRRLASLSLDGNQLTRIPEGLFEGLAQLSSLRLHGNRLPALRSSSFEGLPGIRWLSLGGNALSQVPGDAFEGMGKLENLDLSGNRIARLEPEVFHSLTNLSRLDLRDNRLEEIDPGAFGSLSRLGHLALDGNRLESLPPGLFDALEQLDHLALHGNPLSPELRASRMALAADEGLASAYSLSLVQRPRGRVRVRPLAEEGGVDIEPAVLEFSPEDWSAAKEIRVKPHAQGPDRTARLSHRMEVDGREIRSAIRVRVAIRDMDRMRERCLRAPAVPSRHPPHLF